jgi:arylsulfatase A-like enzyme
MISTRRRVLIFGADGLRPDQIDRTLMPNLAALEANGVRFADHHSVYPPHTRVNGSSFTTGRSPGQHGIVANTMIVPFATEDHIIDTGDYRHLDALKADGGAQLAVSLSDLIVKTGKRVAVAGTGSSGSNVLWTFNDRGRIVNTGSTYGIADLYDLREKLGEIPEPTVPNLARNGYATRAVTEIYLGDDDIAVITLWLAEPDSSLHKTGIGSPETTIALKSVDDCLGAVLAEMDRRRLRDQFDVFILSDHGHSTIRAHRTLREYLIDAKKEIPGLPNFVTASDYVYAVPGEPEPDLQTLAPLVEWFNAQPWADIVLGGMPGTETLPGVIPLSALWNGHTNKRRPLLGVSPVWSDDTNEFGVPGTVSALTTQAALKSSHGALSPYDMHCTCIAGGPSFRQGLVSTTPTGVIDITPTILSILGIELPDGLDGRILQEGLAAPTAETADAFDERLQPTVPGSTDKAVIIHHVGGTTYVHGTAQSGTFDTGQSPAA